MLKETEKEETKIFGHIFFIDGISRGGGLFALLTPTIHIYLAIKVTRFSEVSNIKV